MRSPEEQFKRNRQLFENRCYRCNGLLHRIRSTSPGSDFTDCRDYLPSVSVQCEDCETRYKRKRMFVPGGDLRADHINEFIKQFGWPIPAFQRPPLEIPPTPPSLEEIKEQSK